MTDSNVSILDVKNGVYSNAEGTSITCEILIASRGDYIKFTATKNDIEDHGRRVYEELVSGRWGHVDAYIPPYTEDQEFAIQEAKLIKQISTWRDREENREFTIQYAGREWDDGRLSMARIEPVAKVASLGMLPPSFFWTDANNEDIQMTSELLSGLYDAMVVGLVLQGFKIHQRQRDMKEEISKITDLQELKNYVVGW